MADIDFGTGPGTGDTLPQALTKLQTRDAAVEANVALHSTAIAALQNAPAAALPTSYARVVARVFDVTLYGLVGDANGTQGTGTDNTAAFAALLAVVALAGGGVIYFPAGTYRFATPRVRITSPNTSIDGPGARLFFDTADIRQYGRVLFDGYTSSGGVLSPGTISNVGIRNVAVFNRAGVVTDLNAAVDPLGGDPWGAQSCLITFRGCRGFFAHDCELFQGPGWTINVYESRNGLIRGCHIHDMIADGVHVQAGSVNVIVAQSIIENVGDDALAVGFSNSTAVNTNIIFYGNVISGTGACGIAIYGPTAGVSVSGQTVDGTWASGLKLVPLSITPTTSSTSYSIAASTITDVSVGANTWRNIGMRDPSLYSRAQGSAFGIVLDSNGGTIRRVAIGSGQNFYNVRNQYVAQNATGTLSSVVLAPGSVYDTLVSGGAGNAGSGGGTSTTPSSAYTAVVEYSTNSTASGGTSGGTTSATASDDFGRADASPSSTALGSTPVGNKAYTVTNGTAGIANNKAYFASSGSYPNASIDSGLSDVDVSVDVTFSGSNARVYARQSSGVELAWDSGGSAYYYDATNGLCNVNNAAVTSVTASSGTHTMRLVVKGNVISGYFDGTQIFTGQPERSDGTTVTMTTGTGVAFGDAANPTTGNTRFDNFVVKAA